MKSLRYYGPGDIRLEETAIPVLSAGELLIRVEVAGICATDVKTFQRGHPKIQPGSVIGHEISGVISDVNQVGGWMIGDKVTVAPYAPCKDCFFCNRGDFINCERLMADGIDPGGFSEYVRVPRHIVRQGLFKLPDNLPFSIGCFAEPLACCVHGLVELELKPDDVLLIVGDGTMGLLQAMIARQMGVDRIILTGLIPERLNKAKAFTDMVIDINKQDTILEVNRFSRGGADKVMVSVGIPEVVEDSIQLIRKGGILNIYAGMPKEKKINIDPNSIHYDGIKLLGTFGFTPEHFKKAVNLLLPLRKNIESIISGMVNAENFSTALMDMVNYRGIKYLINFSDTEGGAYR